MARPMWASSFRSPTAPDRIGDSTASFVVEDALAFEAQDLFGRLFALLHAHRSVVLRHNLALVCHLGYGDAYAASFARFGRAHTSRGRGGDRSDRLSGRQGGHSCGEIQEGIHWWNYIKACRARHQTDHFLYGQQSPAGRGAPNV